MDPQNIKDMAGRLKSGGKGMGIGGGVVAVVVAAGYALSKSLYTVDGGHRAIIFSRLGGVQHEVYKEGLHVRIPWFQWPIIYDIRSKPRKLSSISGSKDLQMVNLSLRVLARPDERLLPQMYKELGMDYDDRVLPSICNEVLKSVVAKFNASQLITMRQQVSIMIRNDLVDRARDFHIILDDVSITDLTFSKEYAAAVESKQVAQQDAQRSAFFVDRARQEKQQMIVQAEGEARAAELIGKALSLNPGYLKLRKIRAAQNVARTISKSQNRVYLNAGTLMLNIQDEDFDRSSEKLAKK